MRRMISQLGSALPKSVRYALVGSPGNPSPFACALHDILNQLPGDRVLTLPCKGVLQGYQMKIDWQRHRSFVYGTWETEVVNAMQELVQPGTCVVDIGAHIGFYTLVLSKFVGPSGRVLAFEPLPGNFSVLSENIRLNHLHQAEAVPKAVLDRSCELSADMFDDGPLPGSVPFSTPRSSTQPHVSAVALDDFLENESAPPVKFMKVDVEGAESLVLKGASRTITTYHPALIIEIHHFGSSADKSPVLDTLHDWGYSTQWLNKWKDTSHLLAT